MANYFCDHGAYGLASNRLGLDAPATWAVPQEGDGTTKDAATASSVASIAFASVPTTGVFSCCGVSISTTGVIGAASADAAANTLATNINAVTTAVAAGVAVGTPQLRNLVYARGPSGGAPAGTCQIMMRIGSTSLNYATNANAAIASTFDGTPTVVQFVGGSGGCWGWALNPTAIGAASSITLCSYGALFFTPYVGTIPTINDVVWMRTGGGASKTISAQLASYGGISITHSQFSTTVKFDTNTQWTGDVTNGVLKLYLSGAYGAHYNLYLTSINQKNSYIALSNGGFTIQATSTSDGGLVINGGQDNSSFLLQKVKIELLVWVAFNIFNSNGVNSNARYVDCDIISSPSSATIQPLAKLGNYFSDSNLEFIGCRFSFNVSGVSDPGGLVDVHANYPVEGYGAFIGCKFSGFAQGFTLVSATSIANFGTNNSSYRLIADGCSGLKMPGNYIGVPISVMLKNQAIRQVIINQFNAGSASGMRVEDTRGIIEWLPSASPAFPTLGSTIIGSGTPWSLKMIWLSKVPLGAGFTYQTTLRMMHQLASGVRTFTLELFLPSTVTDGVEAFFSYKNAAGDSVTAYSQTLQSSAVTWTGAASYPSHVAKKLTVTTADSVASGSEIICTIELTKVAPATQVDIYIDPEFGVA